MSGRYYVVLSVLLLINFNLCIGARYVDPSIEASTIVTFNHLPPIHLKSKI